MKNYLLIAAAFALTSTAPAQYNNYTRLAASPAGDAMFLHEVSSGIQPYYNTNPLSNTWTTGTIVPLSAGANGTGNVVYSGNGRYLVAWRVEGKVYSSYTDDQITWSTPLELDDVDNTTGANLQSVASDGQGKVLLQWSEGQIYCRRSNDGGTSFLSAELQLDENGTSYSSANACLATNGAGTWYRAYARLNNDISNNESTFVQSSLDGGLTWSTPTLVAYASQLNRTLLGLNASDSRAVVITNAHWYFPQNAGFALTSTENNGGDWAKLLWGFTLPSYFSSFSPQDREAAVASDSAGNRVVLYKAAHPDANQNGPEDFDILAFKSATVNGSGWDSTARYVSRQRDRDESSIYVTSLGIGKFLAVYNIKDSANSNIKGAQSAISTDAGSTWTPGEFVWGSVPQGQLWDYTDIEEPEPQPPAKFTVSSVTPKIKYKEPKPGKPPKPRKAMFKILLGTTPELVVPESVTVKLYLSDNESLEPASDNLLYIGSTKPIKPGKSGKANIKFSDFPDPAGKYILIQIGNAAPYVLAM